MSRRLPRLRRLSQLAFLGAFLALFAFAGRLSHPRVPVDLFLRADPLLALSAMLSLRQFLLTLFWYALPVVLLSILLGRAFCGWICPMGTAIDLCERLFRIRARGAPEGVQRGVAPGSAEADREAGPRGSAIGPSRSWRAVKFYLLIALLVTMILPAAHRSIRELKLGQTVGLSAAYLVDPIAILTRTLTLAGVPPAQSGITFLRDTALVYSDVGDERPRVGSILNWVADRLQGVAREQPPHFRLGVIAFLIFVGIVALGRFARRFWCRCLCPLGALLGFLGKLSPLRLRVSERCTRCLRCVRECKMGAILEDPTRYHGTECIWCGSCLAVCPERAISVTARSTASGRKTGLDLERRRVLEAMGVGLAAVVLPKVDWSARHSRPKEQAVFKLSSERLIRPPGALAEDAFVTACVRCGECMKVCPRNALQPAFGEGGLEAVGTPILVPRMGECADYCAACGEVCPTRAIQPFRVEEKRYLYLGTANVDRSKCIAWTYGRQCMVCDEVCPYDAIYPDLLAGVGRPVVDDRICVGCGMCEFSCPVEPRGAIRVSASGDKRHLSRAEQRALREAAVRAEPGEGVSVEGVPSEQDIIDRAPYPSPYPQ